MAKQCQPGHQEVAPCLLTDYDDDVVAHRESFQAFMARQAEEHWATEINSLDIEGPADRIATVIEYEASKLTKKLDKIATAMAVETSGAQARGLLAMIPSKENLMVTLEDLAFSKLQLIQGSAERPLAIDYASSPASEAPTETQMVEQQSGSYWNISKSALKKRCESPLRAESTSPSKRRRVTYSEDTSSSGIEFPPAPSPVLLPSNSNHEGYSSLYTVAFHEVQGREWMFHFQGSGRWYILRCRSDDCFEQGPGMLTRLRAHIKAPTGCHEPDNAFISYTDPQLVGRFGYQVTGGVFDRGFRQEISDWVNSSNDTIRYRNMNR